MYLSVPVPDEPKNKRAFPFTLEDCIQEFTKEEILENDD